MIYDDNSFNTVDSYLYICIDSTRFSDEGSQFSEGVRPQKAHDATDKPHDQCQPHRPALNKNTRGGHKDSTANDGAHNDSNAIEQAQGLSQFHATAAALTRG